MYFIRMPFYYDGSLEPGASGTSGTSSRQFIRRQFPAYSCRAHRRALAHSTLVRYVLDTTQTLLAAIRTARASGLTVAGTVRPLSVAIRLSAARRAMASRVARV